MRAASARACTSKPRVRGSRAVPPVAPTARTPARILVVERASSWRVHPSIVPLSVKKPRVTMPTPVPTDILVRPRVPEAPLRPLPPGALLAASAALLASFEPDKMSLDAHADRFFAPSEEGAFGLELKRFDARKADRAHGRGSWGAKTRDPEDQVFCRQVLYGVTRYEKMLDAFVDAFYKKHAARLSRHEKIEARVCSYLALLRLDELGLGAFGAILAAHPSGARFAVPFLQFAFDTKTLRECGVVDKWRALYDDAFVANALGFLDDGRDDALALLDRFKRDLEGFHGKNSNDVSDSDVSDDDEDEEEEDQEARRDASRVKRRPVKRRPAAVTVPEPFNIARSRPRPAPPVEAKPEPFKANPVPISTRRFGPTAEQIAVRRAEARNREAVAAKYADPRLAFRLRAVERPSNVEKVRAEMEAREIAAIEAERASVIPIARSVPASNAPGFVDPKAGPVKTNAAAILRADAVLRARREKEMAAVEDFEAGLRDSSEYEAWRSKMRLEDEANRAVEVAKTREASVRAHEEARAARAEAAAARAERGAATRSERETLRLARDASERASLENAKATRDKVASAKRMGLEQARAVLAEEKKRAAEARTAERASTAARLAEARRRELAKKAESVREIRAETQAADSTTEGHGTAKLLGHRSLASNNPHGVSTLEDMSVSELRERLALVAKRAEAKETKRRERFRSEREARADFLANASANVERHRADASLTAKQRREQRAVEDERRRALVAAKRAEDEETSRIKKEAKRSERARLKRLADAAEEAERFARATRPANDPTLARRKERSVLLSQSREQRVRETEARKTRFLAQRSRATEKKAILERRDEENERKSKFELEYEARLRAAGKADETMRRDDARRKREAVDAERARVESVRATFRDLAYDTSQNDTSLPENARALKKSVSVAKSAVGPASLRAAGLASDVSRGAFSGTTRRAKTDALREAYREEFQEFGGGGLTRDTMLDAPAASGGVARAVADET